MPVLVYDHDANKRQSPTNQNQNNNTPNETRIGERRGSRVTTGLLFRSKKPTNQQTNNKITTTREMKRSVQPSCCDILLYIHYHWRNSDVIQHSVYTSDMGGNPFCLSIYID